MTSARPRSAAARCGLLIVAMLHIMVTAALPFTHRHPPPDTGAVVIAAADAAERGAPAGGHADLCTICQTFRAAHAASTAVQPAVGPASPDAPHVAETSAVPSSSPIASSLPRAPPRA